MAKRILPLIGNGLHLRCPRCGIGPLYAKPFRMHSNCHQCDLQFEREQGYFIGAIYVNYAATGLIAVPGFFILDAFEIMTIHQQLALWVPFAVIFPLAFFHHSRSIWLVIDHLLSPAQNIYSAPPKQNR